MELPRSIDTVVVGAGQAGLIMSRLLTAAGREHVVLERRESLGGGWQDRWDAFQLVSPNFIASLPDYPYDGPEPDGYMTRDEMVGRIRAYADVVGAPRRGRHRGPRAFTGRGGRAAVAPRDVPRPDRRGFGDLRHRRLPRPADPEGRRRISCVDPPAPFA